MSKKILIVLVGGPCSGKSSAGKLVADRIHARYTSSGDIAREMAQNNKGIMNDLNAGKLAPEDEMRSAISAALWQHFVKNNRDIMILDGFPRFGEQAEWLHNEISNIISIRYVLIHAPSWVLRDRAKNRNRSDDDSFEQRYSYYRNITYKELYNYINTIIWTDNMSIEGCATVLEDYIKEVIDSVEDS